MKLSILMPAYDEERTIIQAIDQVLSAEYPCDAELIVVDDGSTDATSALLDQVDDPRVRVHRHPVNRGKETAVLSATAFATGTRALLFDADLEHSPDDISSMLAPVRKGPLQRRLWRSGARNQRAWGPVDRHVTALSVNHDGSKVSASATG